MKFFKWLIKTTWFHILWVIGLILFTLTWPSGDDKNIGITFLIIVLSVLIGGKYNYWNKNLKNKGNGQ